MRFIDELERTMPPDLEKRYRFSEKILLRSDSRDFPDTGKSETARPLDAIRRWDVSATTVPNAKIQRPFATTSALGY
jgi:hypothetical protein